MASGKLHALSPVGLFKPLCGRQLTRLGTAPAAHTWVQGTHTMQCTPVTSDVSCRHCLRALGHLPPIGRNAFDPDEETDNMSDDELLDALTEEEECEVDE